MLKRIINILMLIIILLIAVYAGYVVGVNNTVRQSSISLEDYDIIDSVCRKATTDQDGYELSDFTMSDCKQQIFKATGKL